MASSNWPLKREWPLNLGAGARVRRVQGCDASGALVEAVLAAGLSIDDAGRRRPPLPALRRVAAASDPEIVTFGHGRRPCPATAHARAAASAVLDVVRDGGSGRLSR